MHQSTLLKINAPVIGTIPSGPLNLISDVTGVKVGHATLSHDRIQTGVTVVHTHGFDPFLNKTPAAVAVINGFGKSVGLVQVDELGQLETPIALTNTFSVGSVAKAQILEAINRHPEIGKSSPTVNPVVFECNDGFLNDMHQFAVAPEHYDQACRMSNECFEQGSVGAGRGMSAFSLKGGIGSASRCVRIERGAQDLTVGALVLANFGKLSRLTVGGVPLGRHLDQKIMPAKKNGEDESEKGSIIVVLATDAPLDSRQLKRLAWRAAAGLAATGSVYGHGSGDIVLAFSTAYQIPAEPSSPMPSVAMMHESRMDPLFEAAAEATEQAIVNALWSATTVRGRDGYLREAMTDILPDWQRFF